MTAADLFAQTLIRRGIGWAATLCGHGLDPLYDAFRRAGLRLIDTRNEQTASFIAESAGRLTGLPGVCATSSGVAFINALSGASSAWFDQAPMLLISGSAALRTAGLGHFQDMDQPYIARSFMKYARAIDCPERAAQILDEALDAAAAAPRGPVHITFPMDIQTAPVDESKLIHHVPLYTDGLPADVTSALENSSRPLIVAGSGIFYARQGAALLEFAERSSIPVVTPIWDRGCVDHPSPVFCGVIGAATGGARLLPDADCVILAGAAPDYRTAFLQTDACCFSLTHGWAGLRIPASPARLAWLAEARRRVQEFRSTIRQTALRQSAIGGMHALHVIDALQQVLTDDSLFLIDGGSIGQWAHQLLTDRYPSRWLTCGRSGVVGWGVGGAMAARLAYPSSPVILLSGDGAFTFNALDLECAVRQKLPFVAIVADDCAWGITYSGHLRQFGESISSSLGPIDFGGLAVSLGARAVRIEEPSQIAPAIGLAVQSAEVTLIHVPIIGGNPA